MSWLDRMDASIHSDAICAKCGAPYNQHYGMRCDPDADQAFTEASDWRPIDSAPKRGRILLGYAPTSDHEDGFVGEGHWTNGYDDGPDDMGHDGGFMDANYTFFRCPRSFGIESYRTNGLQPTHWMPLPAAPTAPKGGAQE